MSDKALVASIHPDGYVEVQLGLFRKKVSVKDFASVINNMVAQEDQVVANSTYRYPSSIHSVTSTNSGFIANLYYDERELELRHSSGGKKMVYMPNVMIRVELRKVNGLDGEFSIGNVRWFATDKSRIALPTDWPNGSNTRDHIWTLPLPNIFNDARMCTGGNRLPSVIYRDWSVLDMLYYDVLVGSPFNNDLSVPSLISSESGGSWINTLHDHWAQEDTERFPYNLLVNY